MCISEPPVIVMITVQRYSEATSSLRGCYVGRSAVPFRRFKTAFFSFMVPETAFLLVHSIVTLVLRYNTVMMLDRCERAGPKTRNAVPPGCPSLKSSRPAPTTH
ncbi:hypothetical protein CALCODRAFT_289038 [Calocera cornea HHB12733]|uniref:Uncharacterized protein n=1 Tax=Calocera cornea HHB12733 TaxID=1353952 RepID=A0A165FVU8_9BASI|nr:hypothetical protein CALCODRAFT_289038 [Calocera cornea HHB12733]